MMESSKDIICKVTPLDIGIETAGGVNTVLIPRGTALPAKRSQVFSTAHDGQSSVIVNISQGNRPMFSDNILVGQFSLNGIPSAPRGVLQEEVTVSVDENGVISVTARDLGTGREKHAAIASSSALSEDKIERAKRDAEMNAEDDRLRAELANVKNSAEALCFAIEKSLEENSSKVLDDEKKAVWEALKSTRETVALDSMEKIKDASRHLNEVWEPIVKKIYAACKGSC